jgi:acyl-CoA thioesterase YciA
MKFLTRKLVQPQHLNVNNTLFGGVCMAWVDEEAAIFATTEMKTSRVVTKKISEINFIAPGYQGDIIEIGVELKRVGKTSITLGVEVRNMMTQKVIVKIDELVFVALDENGKPSKHALSIK